VIEVNRVICLPIWSLVLDQVTKTLFDAEGIDMPYPNTELSGGIKVTNEGSETVTGD